MSLQFIMGNSGAGKSRYAYQKILAEAARHPEKNYLIVVPEQFTMQTQKELVSLHPAGGILNIDILSFQRLAYRIFEETGGSLYPVLEETGKRLVVKRVAQEKKKELTILGSTLKRTGAVSQMKSLISELKQYQIAPSELDTWAEETGEKKLLAAKPRRNSVSMVRDVRIFLNTLEHAVGLMVQGGVAATSSRQEGEGYIEYTVRIPVESMGQAPPAKGTQKET